MIQQAKTKFPLDTLKAAPWIQTLVQLLQRKAMSSNNLRDAEIWNHQLGSTLLNTPRLSSSTERSSPSRRSNKSTDSSGGNGSEDRGSRGEGGSGSGSAVAQDAQLDDTSLELQLDILLQNALLSVLVGQRQLGVHQLSEGLAILQQNQWSGTHKFTIMYLLALAEIFMVRSQPILIAYFITLLD